MNTYRRRVRIVAMAIWAAAFLCAATGVPAQTLHRQTDSEGRTTFGDRADATPSPRAETVEAPEATPVRKSAISPRRSAMIEANEAQRVLKQARLARERGAEPLPAERVRSAGAGAVNHRYWRRQEKLRRDVEQALRRSNETRRSFHASR